MGRIRSFTMDDLQQVVALNRRIFPDGAYLPADVQEDTVTQVCYHNPWYHGEDLLSSIVHEEEDGTITGFLGIVPRRMYLNGHAVRVATTQHLIADPDSRSKLIGVRLLQQFMSGPQDLSLANQASDIVRKIWECLGGTTSFLYSYYWVRPLRPVCYALARLRSFGKLTSLARLTPLGRIIDAMAMRMPGNPFRQAVPRLFEEDLSVDTLLECLSQAMDDRWLRPDYDARSMQWLLKMITQEHRFGPLQKIVLRDENRGIVGWYLYYLNQHANSQVLQIGARKHAITEVLDHLAYHARQRGAVGLLGQLEPRLMPTDSHRIRKFGFIVPGTNWMLIHAKDPELLNTIYRGEAFLSRMEGELKLL